MAKRQATYTDMLTAKKTAGDGLEGSNTVNSSLRSAEDNDCVQIICSEQPFSKELSASVMVYARSPDVEDTVVIRDVYSTKFKAFGLKGHDDIKTVFRAIVKTLAENKKVLNNLRYGVWRKTREFY